ERKPEAFLQGHQQEKETIEEPRAQSGIPSSGQNRNDGLKDRLRRLGIKEKIAKLRCVKADDEAAERLVSLARPFRIRGERPLRKIIALQRAMQLIRGFDSRLHRDRYAGGEDRIEKRARVAGQDPSIARIFRRAVREVLLH